MASPIPATGFTLEMRRTFAAPREKVFQAWTEREKLEAWFCHSKPSMTGRYTEFDLRPGGRYRAEVSDANGKTHVLQGVYQEIKPPERLVFSWSWETSPQYGETVVTLEFLERGTETELVLIQEAFPTAESRDAHNTGWTPCFDSLDRFLKV
jgi:uncharacterized protein YndB with AHSA1/START domain